jgi:acyl-CoA reductase-like NAD-dependent aldehyde dehydrogenase
MLKRQATVGRVFPIFVGGKPVTTATTLKVFDKYTKQVGYEVSLAGPQEIENALQLAHQAAPAMRELPNYKRKEILLYCAAEIQRRQDELLHSLCVEAGKPLKDARAELGRAYDTFTIAAEEAIRQYGEILPLDVSVRYLPLLTTCGGSILAATDDHAIVPAGTPASQASCAASPSASSP